MDTDIRKPITHKFGIERPANLSSYSTTDIDDDEIDSDDEADGSQITGETTPVEDARDDDDEQQRQLKIAHAALEDHRRQQVQDEFDEANGTANGHAAAGNSLDEEERINALALDDSEYIYDSDDEDMESALEEARRTNKLEILPTLCTTPCHSRLQRPLQSLQADTHQNRNSTQT